MEKSQAPAWDFYLGKVLQILSLLTNRELKIFVLLVFARSYTTRLPYRNRAICISRIMLLKGAKL